MKGFALTTAVVPGTPYFESIWPLTSPIMQEYCDTWEIDWKPDLVSYERLAEFRSPAPPGTEAVYANIPYRRQLLDEYKGVLFLDSDCVIVDHTYDLCRQVSENVPIAATELPGFVLNAGVMAFRSCAVTKDFLDKVWSLREYYWRFQWLEMAAIMALMGYDPEYPGDGEPSRFLGDTEWTPYLNKISTRWNSTTFHPHPNPLIFHPAGTQPFSARLRLIQESVTMYYNRTREMS